MNLYPELTEKIIKNIKASGAKTVFDIWRVFRTVISNSALLEHKNANDLMVNCECCDIEGERILRLGIEYRLKYLIDKELYEHSEDISCEFTIDKIDSKLLPEDKPIGVENHSDSYSLNQIFDNVESWSAFNRYKDDVVKYSVNGCEI